MPIVPILNLGLAPLLQWIVIPTVSLMLVKRASRHGSPRRVLD